MSELKQSTAHLIQPRFALIPPLAPEFGVYGGREVTERARAWALENRLLLADGGPPCAHGLYLMASCPNGSGCRARAGLDHASIWVPAGYSSSAGRPFVLAHPYEASFDPEKLETYATAHGLGVSSRNPADRWYNAAALPVRLSLPEDWPAWPLELAVPAMLAMMPVRWPEESPGI